MNSVQVKKRLMPALMYNIVAAFCQLIGRIYKLNIPKMPKLVFFRSYKTDLK